MTRDQKNAKRRAAAFEKRQDTARAELSDELQAIYDETQALMDSGDEAGAFKVSLTHAAKCEEIAKLGRGQRVSAQEFKRKERARAKEEARAEAVPTESSAP